MSEQKYLKVEIKVDSWITHHADPYDQWDRDSTDGNVTVTGCRLIENDEYQTLPCPQGIKRGDVVYVVWAQYSTADSFGSDGGQFELCGIFGTKEDAQNEKARLKDVTDYSVPWNGYFEHLDSLNVQALTVE